MLSFFYLIIKTFLVIYRSVGSECDFTSMSFWTFVALKSLLDCSALLLPSLEWKWVLARSSDKTHTPSQSWAAGCLAENNLDGYFASWSGVHNINFFIGLEFWFVKPSNMFALCQGSAPRGSAATWVLLVSLQLWPMLREKWKIIQFKTKQNNIERNCISYENTRVNDFC